MFMVMKPMQIVCKTLLAGQTVQLTPWFHIVKYRTMDWWKAAALMLAETVSLGVCIAVILRKVLHILTSCQILSIPSVFVSLGMVGGCIAVVVSSPHHRRDTSSN